MAHYGKLFLITFVFSAYLVHHMLSNDSPIFKKMDEIGLLDMTLLWNRGHIETIHKAIGDEGLKYLAEGYLE